MPTIIIKKAQTFRNNQALVRKLPEECPILTRIAKPEQAITSEKILANGLKGRELRIDLQILVEELLYLCCFYFFRHGFL